MEIIIRLELHGPDEEDTETIRLYVYSYLEELIQDDLLDFEITKVKQK